MELIFAILITVMGVITGDAPRGVSATDQQVNGVIVGNDAQKPDVITGD